MPFAKGHSLWKNSVESRKKIIEEKKITNRRMLPDSIKRPGYVQNFKNVLGLFNPRKYSFPAIFNKKAEAYFAHQDEIKKPYTLSGLCNFLGISLGNFDKYSQREGFQESCTLIRQKVEQYTEEALFWLKNPNGAMYILQNRNRWKTGREENAEAGTKVIIQIAPELHKKYARVTTNNENISIVEMPSEPTEIKNLPPQNA